MKVQPIDIYSPSKKETFSVRAEPVKPVLKSHLKRLFDRSDDEFDVFGESINGGSPPADACDILKSLVPCASVVKKNLLADTAMIVEKNKNCKRKDELRKIMTDGLVSLGDYEYIDVVGEGERMLIDVDFRSEFEMARSIGAYKAIVQSLPFIFVGKPNHVDRIVSIVSEAAKQSLKKKGMHLLPWRKAEYMRAKWLSQFARAYSQSDDVSTKTNCGSFGELDLIFGEEKKEKGPCRRKIST
ncbi:hypothetical protein REPUB_Repub15cG0056500 [Reevesia pubescens]